MPSTAKTILIWLLILVCAVTIYTFVERAAAPSSRVLSLTELLERLDKRGVKEVTVSGSDLSGLLIANEPFRATIPENYNAILFEKLTAAGVQVTILPPERNWWSSMSSLPMILVTAGLVLWIVISIVILVLIVDLARFVKRELGRSRGNTSTA